MTVKLSKVQYPTRHSLGHFKDNMFYRSDDPTSSVKALEEGG